MARGYARLSTHVAGAKLLRGVSRDHTGQRATHYMSCARLVRQLGLLTPTATQSYFDTTLNFAK